MVRKRWRIELTGTLQGIGIRPLVWHIAHSRNLSGFVRNRDQGVVIEVQGPGESLENFVADLEGQLPKGACIESKFIEELPVAMLDQTHDIVFEIQESSQSSPLVCDSLPDLAPCKNCLSELYCVENRRYLFPMISCTRCGPRYSIAISSPYERHRTALADFLLCGKCQAEYAEPSEGRFHSQTIGCFDCGPQWSWSESGSETTLCNNPDSVVYLLERFKQIVTTGGVVLIKGVGGYQLLCDASNQAAVERIRKLKHREHKPFALLVDSIESASQLVDLSANAYDALEQSHRPIVVAYKKVSVASNQLASGVTLLSGSLGVMLPNNPMQFLYAKKIAGPLVLTSANTSDEPMLIDDRQAIDTFADAVDAVLTHSRIITQPLDDPVYFDTSVGLIPVRLGRGNAPLRIPVPQTVPLAKATIALGADLKSAWGMLHSNCIYLMQQLGDAASPVVVDRIDKSIARVIESGLAVDSLVTDLHPGYQTTMLGEKIANLHPINSKPIDNRSLQHHAAHLAALATDSQIHPDEPFLGFVLDGTGFGADGTVWGGELIGVQGKNTYRIGHLRNYRLPHGDVAARYPWRSGLALLVDSDVQFEEFEKSNDWTKTSPWGKLGESEQALCMATYKSTSLSHATSSMGRFLDGLASLMGIVHENQYEGHAAMMLEDSASIYYRQCTDKYSIDAADLRDGRPYLFGINVESGVLQFDGRPVVRRVLDDLNYRIPRAEIAFRIHAAIALMMVQSISHLPEPWRNLRQIGLTGGVFQNRLLTELTVGCFRQHGYQACLHRRVPPNDSGIAVGQIRMAK